MTRKPSALDVDALIQALPPSLVELAQRGVAHPYRKGSTLIEEGVQGDTLYIVLAGRLRAFSTSATRNREITYGTYGAGEYVGEMSLDGGPRSASVETLEPSICVVVTRTSLQAHIAAHPAFAFELLAKVIGRARAATLSVRQMALNDVYGRVKLLLEGMAGKTGAGGWTRLDPPFTHREAAARVGCSREMVSRVLGDLETGGHVKTSEAGLLVKLPLPARW